MNLLKFILYVDITCTEHNLTQCFKVVQIPQHLHDDPHSENRGLILLLNWSTCVSDDEALNFPQFMKVICAIARSIFMHNNNKHEQPY